MEPTMAGLSGLLALAGRFIGGGVTAPPSCSLVTVIGSHGPVEAVEVVSPE
jgi:hypothetical protein